MSKIAEFLSMQWVDKKFILRKKLLMPLFRKQYGNLGVDSCIEKELIIRGKEHIFIGNDVFIRPGARIECISDFAGDKYESKLVIGNNVNIEQFVHIVCAKSVVIDNDVVISSNVLITDNNHGHKQLDINPLMQPLEVSSVHIGSYTLIGSGSKIMPGVDIGKNVVVGANSVVTKNVPDYSIVVGCPARIIKKFDFKTNKWIKVE